MDQDTRAVAERLSTAVAKSGLSMRQFAHALGTSPSRFSSYQSGKVAPSAAFLLRAERIADALARARRDNIPTAIDAVDSIRRADRKDDDDWTYAVTLEARDRLRDILQRRKELAAAWEAQPASNLADRWRTLVAAFVSHEFAEAGLPVPGWAAEAKLDGAWVLDSPRLSDDEIRRQTPEWLAERNIFIAEKDLVTQ
jgi:transcriptional regulator with XRE-family HTH domain